MAAAATPAVDNSRPRVSKGADSLAMTPELETPIRSAPDLLAVWRRLMGPGGFGRRSIWFVFIDADDRLQRVIMPIDDVPEEPDPLVIRNLAMIFTELRDDGQFASTAMLLSRPGPGQMTGGDRRWAQALRAGLGHVSPWPVHLATTDDVRVFAPDDLIAA